MLSLITLLSLHAALAAAPVPVQLPSAEPPGEWPQLLAEAGLGLGAPGGWGASVTDPGDGTTWQVHLVDKGGAVKDLVVLIPTNESERADLVWYLAKLLGAEPPPLEPIPPQPVAAAPVAAAPAAPTPAPVAAAIPAPVADVPLPPPAPSAPPLAGPKRASGATPAAPAPVAAAPTPVAAAPAPAPVAAAPAPAPTPVAAAPTPVAAAPAPVAAAPAPVAAAPAPVAAAQVTPAASTTHVDAAPSGASFMARAAFDLGLRGQTAAAAVPELDLGVQTGPLRAAVYGALRTSAAVSGVGDGKGFHSLELGAGAWLTPDLPVGAGLLFGGSWRTFTSTRDDPQTVAVPVIAAEGLGHFALGRTGAASKLAIEPLARVQIDLRSIELQAHGLPSVMLPGWECRVGVGVTWGG